MDLYEMWVGLLSYTHCKGCFVGVLAGTCCVYLLSLNLLCYCVVCCSSLTGELSQCDPDCGHGHSDLFNACIISQP